MSAIIDWCTCTFAFQQGKVKFGELPEDLSTLTALELIAQERGSSPGYTNGMQTKSVIDNVPVNFAVFVWGGESQKGWTMLDFSGACCGCIDDWELFRGFLKGLPESRLTRVAVAVDLLDGRYTDDPVRWHGEGLFNAGGNSPKIRTDCD